MIVKAMENVRKSCPLIHNITNYVTVNDCANILLACGASPIMADDINEVEEITSICGGLNINIGTLNKDTIPAMILAGKKANALDHPVLLDPVGVGASILRMQTAQQLLKEVDFTVIRGNISEIKILFHCNGNTKGVDADLADIVTEENLSDIINFAKQCAKKTGAVIVITGAIDIVATKDKACIIRNGHPMMTKVTGTGCMLSAMTTAYVVANRANIFTATVSSVCAMGICGEIAYNRLDSKDGNSSYRNYIIDAVSNIDKTQIEGGAKYEMR